MGRLPGLFLLALISLLAASSLACQTEPALPSPTSPAATAAVFEPTITPTPPAPANTPAAMPTEIPTPQSPTVVPGGAPNPTPTPRPTADSTPLPASTTVVPGGAPTPAASPLPVAGITPVSATPAPPRSTPGPVEYGFAWEADGLTDSERQAIVMLKTLEGHYPDLSQAALDFSWLADGISDLDSQFLNELSALATREPSRAVAVLLTVAPSRETVILMQESRESRPATTPTPTPAPAPLPTATRPVVPTPTPTPTPEARPVATPAPGGVPIAEALRAFGASIRWAALYDSQTGWAVFDPNGSFTPDMLPLSPGESVPSPSHIVELAQLFPGRLYWINTIREVLFQNSRMAPGWNQIIWSSPVPTPGATPTPTPAPELPPLDFPWAQGGLSQGERSALQGLQHLQREHPAIARVVFGHPWVADGVNDAEWRGLYSLRLTTGEIASRVLRLVEFTWFEDGLTSEESSAVNGLMSMGEKSVSLLSAFMSLPWIADGITLEESWTVGNFLVMYDDAPSLTLEIVALPWFTDDFTGRDRQTVLSIGTITRGGVTAAERLQVDAILSAAQQSAATPVTTPTPAPTGSPGPGSLFTALESATGLNDTGDIESLLDQGADPNARNPQGESPLHIAASMSFPKAVTLLLDHGSDIDARDDDNRTPLMTLIIRGWEPDPQVATLLLDLGADVNAGDSVGGTALDYAENYDVASIVRLLKDRGAIAGTQGPLPSPTPTRTPEQPDSTPDPNAQPDYDTDGDGLSEINNLEQLDAMRYDPDGDGVPLDTADLDGDGRSDFFYPTSASRHAAAFPITTGGAVCGGGGCTGYELAPPLDFDGPDSYASGEVIAVWTQWEGWTPIAQCTAYASECRREVTLTFDGNGHTISNLYARKGGFSGYVGLFFRIDGTVRRLGLLDVDLIGRSAPLTATNHGSITDTYVTGTVVAVRRGITGTADASGFAMNNYGTIRDSHSEVELSLREGDSPSSGGGLAGFVWENGPEGTIEDSYATDNVPGRVVQTAGFVFHNNSGTIRDCYATGDVTGLSTGNGGLVNRNGGLIENSYATGFVSYGGGLVRENFDRIVNSYATCDVGSGGSLAYENNGGSIINSYATGDVGYSGRPLTYASAGLVLSQL